MTNDKLFCGAFRGEEVCSGYRWHDGEHVAARRCLISLRGQQCTGPAGHASMHETVLGERFFLIIPNQYSERCARLAEDVFNEVPGALGVIEDFWLEFGTAVSCTYQPASGSHAENYE